MSDRRALIEAIRSHPDDDAPRLILADWLDEYAEGLSGDERAAVVAQAEVLRLGVRMAASVSGVPEHEEDERRIHELESRHGEAWLKDVPKFARAWVRTRDGLPTRLEITGRQFLKHGKRLRREVPYTSMRLRKAGGVLEEIVNAGLLAGVNDLDLSFNDLQDGELIHFFRSPDVAGLRKLDLAHNRFGDRAAEALVSSAPLAGLRRLNVWWCNPCVGRVLAGTTTLTALTELQIGNSGLDAPAVRALLHAPIAHRLDSLELSYNTLDADGGEAVGQAPPLARLRRLSMWGCGLGDSGVAALGASAHLRALEYLGLYGNEIGERGAIAFGRSPVANSLRTIELSDNILTDTGLTGLLAGDAFQRLQQLNLGGSRARTDIRKAGVEALVRSPVASRLRTLNLYANANLGPGGAAALAQSESLANLERLDLGRCGIGPEGGAAIAAARHFRALRYLRLSRNDLGPAFGKALASAPWLATVRDLHLGTNALGDSVETLLDCPRLEEFGTLSLDGNRIGADLRARFAARLGTRVGF
jgi:uncharacterized protein (TIGR02996 family)